MNDKNISMEVVKRLRPDFEMLILKRLGISIRHQKNELEKTIASACKKFHLEPEQYLHQLQHCAETSHFLEYLIEGVTIGETYFFRDQTQMKLLSDVILPDIICKKRQADNLSIRIWSAGCSSGEEIYTIAMLLKDKIKDWTNWRINLLGTDINTSVLEKAMQGYYTEWSMRTITEEYKQRYFTINKNQYVLSRELVELVNFAYLNLNEDDYPSIFNGTNAQDLIICRNVLIYFDHSPIKKIMKRFHESLILGGQLLLGASDPVDTDNVHAIFKHEVGMLFVRPEEKWVPPVTYSMALKLSEPKAAVHKEPAKISPRIPLLNKINYQEINTFLSNHQWQNIVDIPDKHEHSPADLTFLFNAKALAYANQGDLDNALQYCQKNLEIDHTNHITHFTYALVLLELNKLQQAEQELRRTLFLDHQFVAGHFQLGLLLLKNKDRQSGMKSLQNAFAIASSENSEKIVPGSSGVSYGNLAKTLKYEIDLYKKVGNRNYERNL